MNTCGQGSVPHSRPRFVMWTHPSITALPSLGSQDSNLPLGFTRVQPAQHLIRIPQLARLRPALRRVRLQVLRVTTVPFRCRGFEPRTALLPVVPSAWRDLDSNQGSQAYEACGDDRTPLSRHALPGCRTQEDLVGDFWLTGRCASVFPTCVGMRGLEPPMSCSQSRWACRCPTSRVVRPVCASPGAHLPA